ncbi:patatin-like phospholipase family protein [Usitatibacter palustris]|uniref:PNPLA domain-containing protein n=1 Tax=Usitatibacter palustris TaxID=2732487 RepID=A0A6M4H9G4_9PROT|nr:patatin-like phospholipase family protein [Usitatibacter palustris]QJR14687.1 hypothetical protein DSM104440_01497 [Usitatibacter palustris]
MMRFSPWVRAAALLVASLFAACNLGDSDIPAERLPRFEPAPGAAPQIALVFGSGGPRGFAHIGVLKVLEAEGIKPDLVVGSSVGAMVGALYASGMQAKALEQLAMEISVLDFFEVGFVTGGPATGRTIQNFVNSRVANVPIERLKTPFVAVATRARDGELVLFNRGDTGLAVRASGATPGRFESVRIGGEAYVDGDEASPVPIRAARKLGARIVIAIDVSAYEKDTPAGAPAEWVNKDAKRAKLVALEAKDADILLHPNIGYYAGHDEAYRRRVIALAEAYTRAKMPEIRAALGAQRVTARSPEGVASR